MFWRANPWDINGRVVVITGAGGAIGRELAIILRRDYACHLALCDNDEERLQKTVACVTFFDPKNTLVNLRTTTHVVDVSQREAVFAFAEDVRNLHGRCEIVFNNAGVASGGDFDQISPEDFDKVVSINMGGIINVAKAFLPLLKENERAALVNTSSILGLVSFPGSSSYCVSKFAVTALSQTLAVESSRSYPQVRICCVHPGFVRTGLISNSKDHIKGIKSANLDVSKIEKWFQFIGSTEPQVVAASMVDGVRYGKQRILIGTDAHILEFVVRLFPGIVYMPRTYVAILTTTLLGTRLIGKKTIAFLILLLCYKYPARVNAMASKLGEAVNGLNRLLNNASVQG